MKVIGWQLVRLVAEAQRDLADCSVEQIRRSPDRTRLVFVLGSRRGKLRLVLGVRGDSATCYWTSQRNLIPGWDSYERTEVFNRLRSARMIAVGMAQVDRIVRIEFEKSDDEASSSQRYSLVAGWLGSSSNIWLLNPDNDQILESFHSDPDSSEKSRKSRVKTLSLPTPPDLLDWRTLTFAEFRSWRQNESSLAFSDFARRRMWGIDTGLSRQISERLSSTRADREDGEPGSTPQSFWEEYNALTTVARAGINPETPLALPSGGSDPSEIRVDEGSSGEKIPLAELLARCDANQPRKNPEVDERSRLFVTIESALKKNQRRLASLERSLVESGRSDEYKKLGDLLNANRQSLIKGQKEATVDDWQTGQSRVIELNPARSPQQNIDDYYRKSRKAADAIKAALAEQPRILREQQRLLSALTKLESSVDDPEMSEEIAEALGLAGQTVSLTKGKHEPRLPYREFILGKERLWVGRSSRDNDELTLRFARPHDIFFHVHGSPGSHVILKRDNKDADIDKTTLTQAAQIAAYFSKAKHAGLVPVVYAEARFVRKPRKAPAGTVSVEREKTIMVRPLPPPGYHEKKV